MADEIEVFEMLPIGYAEEPFGEFKMSGGADGEEFGDALDEP